MIDMSVRCAAVKALSVVEAMDEFFSLDSALPKRDLIRRVGEILLLKKGKCHFAQLFLRSLIMADWTEEKGPLAPVMSRLGNDRARLYQAAKIKEECFALLSVFRHRMQLETKLALDELAANPTYPDRFQENVRNIMAAINTENGRAVA